VKVTSQARRLKFDGRGFGHRERINNAALKARDSLVLFGGEQHKRQASSFDDKDGAVLSRFFRPARVLVKLATGYFRKASDES
jgi:hypothetical protein